MFCHKCGVETPDDSQFCRKCGNHLGVTSNAGGAAAAPAPAKKKSSSNIGIKLALLAVLIGVLWYIVSQVGKPTTLVRTVARLPIDLTNEIENVHANSWRALTIQVPYDGALTISVQVQRGNPVQMYLTTPAGLDKLKNESQNTYLGGFFAQQARTFQHTERVNQGTYYFVLRDYSLGILSSQASDVAVKARIEP